MIKLGEHRNLPTNLRRPAASSHSGDSTNSSRRKAPADESVLPAKNPALQSQQQAVSLFAETNRDNLQIATRSEIPEQCSASKKASKSTSAADPSFRTKHSSASLEEFKENSLPPSTVSVDDQLSYSSSLYVHDNAVTCNGSAAFTPTVPVVNSDPASTFLPADGSEVMMPVQPVHINIHSVPIYHFVPRQLDLGVSSAAPGTVSRETVSEHDNITTPCLPEAQMPSLHWDEASEPDSVAQSKQMPGNPSTNKRSSTPSSFTKIPPKKTMTKSLQYQCPKCLQRFDRIMAQLQHKCCPERTGGGSLLNRPPLKLFKCLECCEEFSDLESKIRHKCSAQKEGLFSLRGSETNSSCHGGKTGTQAKMRKKGSQNLPRRRRNTFIGEKYGLEAESKKKSGATGHVEKRKNITMKIKLPQIAVKESMSSGPVYYKQFKCGLCSMKYRTVGHLKNHINSHYGSDEYKRNRLPYVCRICKAGFRYSKALKKHAAAKCNGKKKSGGKEQINQSSEMIKESSKKRPFEEVNAEASKTTSIQDNSSSSGPRSEVSRSQLQSPQTDQSSPSKSPHKCGFCGITWDSATTLRKHVRSHWNQIFEKPSNPLICSRCNEEFDNCVKLFLHVRRSGCTTASEDTSQSDEGEPRNEVRTQAAVDKPANSNSGRPEVTACQTRNKGKYSCPHCGLTFWRSEILNVHLQSSHPLLLDQAEFPVENAEKSSPDRNNEKFVEPAVDPVVHTQPLEPVLSNQDLSVTDLDSDSCMRTGIYPCRCNNCNLDFSTWKQLNAHRRTHHPLSVIHLKLGMNQQGGPDESLDEASVDIMEDDFIHSCDLCSRVFRHWRSLALHKKAKHHVKVMFARYSGPNKQPNQEATDVLSSSRTIQQMSTFTSDSVDMEQVPNLVETQENSNALIYHSIEAEATTKKSTNLCKDVSTSPPCDVLPQQPISGINFARGCAISQGSQYFELPGRVEPSTDEDLSLRSSSNPLCEPRLTVEDLKISSVVSLFAGGGQTTDDMQWQRSKTGLKLSVDSVPSEKISEEVPFNVEARIPMSTINVLEVPQTSPLDKIIPSMPTGQGQHVTPDAFNLIVDSVLGMEFPSHPNIFETVTVVGPSSDAISNALSYSEQGWHGTMKKITFSEAKNILRVLEKNSISNCYHCSVCGEWFDGIPHYTSHILAHCDMEKYCCSFCGRIDLNIFAMLDHVISVHCEPNGPTSNQDQSTLMDTRKQSSVDESEVTDLCETSDPESSLDHQKPDANFPRSGCDYVFEPSRLESHLGRNAKSDLYECPLCLFKIKKKSGLMYHLRIHHELHPYRCRYCQQRLSFIPDVQVHFLQSNCQTMLGSQQQAGHQQAGHQQAGTTLGNQVSPSDRETSHQETNSSILGCQSFGTARCGDDHSVPSGHTGCGDPALISSQNSIEVSGELTANTSRWTPCDTVTEEQHRTSDISLKAGSPATKEDLQPIDKDGENLLTTVRVKEERLSDDEAESPNCMMEGNTTSRVKTELPDECDYKGAEWVDQPDGDFRGFEDQPEDNPKTEGNQLDISSDIPCQMPNNILPRSTSSKSFVREMLQKDDPVDEAEVAVSDVMTAEKEHGVAILISQSEGVSELDIVKDCNKNGLKHRDVEDTEEEISHSADHGFEKGAADISNSNALSEICEVTEEPESACGGSDEVLTEDSKIDNAGRVGASMESPVMSSNTVPEDNPISHAQPLDELFRLASDIGIIVTGLNLKDSTSYENSTSQKISPESIQNDVHRTTEGDERSNVGSVTNPNNAHAAEMVLSNHVVSSQGLQTASDSCKLQECASPVGNGRKEIDGDQNIESHVHIQEEHENQLSPSFQKKRSLELHTDSQDTLKRQKIENPQNISMKNNIASDITIVDSCKESGCVDLTNTETSGGPVSTQAQEEQIADNLFLDMDIGEDKIMSDTLKRITKNCFTSRILESFEKDSVAPVVTQNTFNLDLINGPPFVSRGKRAITDTEEKEDAPISEEKQDDPYVYIEHTMDDDDGMSGMPKIFDVAGNGQMPVVPCRNNDSPPFTSPYPDVLFNRASVTKDVDNRGGKTNSYASLEGPVTDVVYSGTSEPAQPCYPMNEGISSAHRSPDERRSDVLLRTMLDYPMGHSQSLNQPRLQIPSPEDHLRKGFVDAQSRRASLSGNQEAQKCPSIGHHTQQSRRNQNQWGRRYSREGTRNQYLKTDAVSPKNIGQDNQNHCLPGSRWSLACSFPDSRVQESRHWSSTMLRTNNQTDSYQYQELYHDSHQRRAPMHSPQEYRQEHFLTSHNHVGALRRENEASMACITRQTEASAAFSHQNVDSREWCWTNNNEQGLRTRVENSSMDNRGLEPSANQYHSIPWQQLDDRSSNHRMTRCSRSYSTLDCQLVSPDADIRQVPPNRPETVHVYQSDGRAPMNAESRDDAYRKLWQRHLRKQHSDPSSSSSTNPGSGYKYQRMGQPITAQRREYMETRQIDEPQQVASHSVQQQRGYSSRTWYPPSHPEENASGGFPQIVSISSLHPHYRYLNRTHSM
ncbi:uncharacterized protein LOC119738687 [Patiria miniata]|uniref:C2H2-type domain-containing protein n=1 Tax=Patiria miniata TaxID=46514 RepID=A0A914B0L8_PATMI|nr:uncharacterized protein LOC119738687 [Patiria miniata]XP_038069538.1 uncharacterized protein LOC119738687 [Patiria miniata]